MKKRCLFLITIIFFVACIGTLASGAPLVGTWGDAYDLGNANTLNGRAAILDPDEDGASLEDEIRARDRSGDSYPGYGHYWFMGGLTRDTLDLGLIVDNLDGTGTRSFDTTRSGGTFYIRGANLWGAGHDALYTASIEGEAHGTSWYDWDQDLNSGVGGWVWNHFEGDIHWWGPFNEDPYLLDFTADGYLDSWGYNSLFDQWIILGNLNNVEMQIDPVPEPATMLLLGSGLVGLAGFRRKKKK